MSLWQDQSGNLVFIYTYSGKTRREIVNYIRKKPRTTYNGFLFWIEGDTIFKLDGTKQYVFQDQLLKHASSFKINKSMDGVEYIRTKSNYIYRWVIDFDTKTGLFLGHFV